MEPNLSNTSQGFVYANFGRRFVAIFLDMLFLGLEISVVNIVGRYTLLFTRSFSNISQTEFAMGNANPLSFIVFILLIFLYALPLWWYLHLVAKGQTLGKKLLGIKVIKKDNGDAPGWISGVFMREFIGRSIKA